MPDRFYSADDIRAVDAKFAALQIAFAPLTFQATRALINLGILAAVAEADDNGLTSAEIAAQTGVSLYGVQVLTEAALGLSILKWRREDNDERLVLGKTGWFLLNDEMTKINLNFANDVCYRGAFHLTESIRDGKPAGLKVFGEQWRTLYEALATLPEPAKSSWFAFDHFYSDGAFADCLPLVFAEKPATIFDFGGNTAKWAVRCCQTSPTARVVIFDLPGQAALATANIQVSGFADRISVAPVDVLTSPSFPLTAGAVWMSQFLACFSLPEITEICRKISAGAATDIFVLEPLWDEQRFAASQFSLAATSLYFTIMANGNSKIYRYGELVAAIEAGGLTLKTAHHRLGDQQAHSLLHFRKAR